MQVADGQLLFSSVLVANEEGSFLGATQNESLFGIHFLSQSGKK